MQWLICFYLFLRLFQVGVGQAPKYANLSFRSVAVHKYVYIHVCITGFAYSEAEYNLLGIGVRSSALCENLYYLFGIGIEVKVISRLLVCPWLLSKCFLLSIVRIYQFMTK